MNASIVAPEQKQAAKLADDERAAALSTATFHEIKRPAPAGALIGIGDWRIPATGPQKPVPSPAPDATSAPGQENSGKQSWRRHIGSARLTWGKLSGGELERIEGDPAKLIKLLLRHYSFDHNEADRQVKSFFHRNRV